METTELLAIVARGEDSKHQLKADFTNADKLAAELVAFSNSGGGILIIGVSDDGTFAGLTRNDMGRLNQLVSNTASQIVRPAINPQTENIAITEGLVMVVHIPNGVSKPYMDKEGTIWVKSGADKRKATSREEIQRMFQSASLIHGDEIPAAGLTVADLDSEYFWDFFRKHYSQAPDNFDIDLPQLLTNMNLMNEGVLNVSGALLFSKNPSFRCHPHPSLPRYRQRHHPGTKGISGHPFRGRSRWEPIQSLHQEGFIYAGIIDHSLARAGKTSASNCAPRRGTNHTLDVSITVLVGKQVAIL